MLRTGVIISFLLFCGQLSAMPPKPSPHCGGALAIDERFAQLPGTKRTDPAYSVALTHLINAAWSPILRDVAARIRSLPPYSFKELIERENELIVRLKSNGDGYALVKHGPYLYTSVYQGRFCRTHALEAPFTDVNRAVIRRFLLAVSVVDTLENHDGNQDWFGSDPFAGAHSLLEAHSFTKIDVLEGLRVANHTIASVAGALTANSVPGLTTDQLLRRVMAEDRGRPSLAVQYALAMPPRLIGNYGSTIYVHSPLSILEGRLQFSARLRMHFKRAHQHIESDKAEEFGHGCPVAHREPGGQRSALQDYLDAIMWVYDRVEI